MLEELKWLAHLQGDLIPHTNPLAHDTIKTTKRFLLFTIHSPLSEPFVTILSKNIFINSYLIFDSVIINNCLIE